MAAGGSEFWTDRYDVEWTSPSDQGPMEEIPFGDPRIKGYTDDFSYPTSA
jgi:hypothetical protein